MSATPTSALVEESEKMAVRALDGTASREEKSVLFASLASALRRAEAELDAATTQLAKKFKRLEELERRAEQAEAERDAQHAEVLRLTGERDEARAEVQTLLWIKSASVKLLDTLQGIRWMEPHEPDDARVIAATRAWVEAAGLTMHAELLKTIEELRALAFGLGCMLTNAQWRERDAAERAQRGLKLMQSCLQDEERKVAELTATRDLLTAENERLQQEHNAYCRKLANDGLTVAGRLQRELDAVRAENDTLHYLLRGGQ